MSRNVSTVADLVISYDQGPTASGRAHILRAVHPRLDPRLAAEGIEFCHVGRESLPEPEVLDGYVMFFLPFAMQYADRLVVEGPVTSRALRNARSFMEYWRCWLPGRYRAIDVVPESVVPDAVWHRGRGARSGRAMSAFSGGVDATFTLLRHAGSGLGLASYPVTDVLMVHGFDVPPSNQRGFDDLRARVQPFLDDVGVNVNVVRTNARLFNDCEMEWNHAFCVMIVAVMHQFSHDFDYGIIGSSQPHNEQFIPWGSTPTTDPLLSGGELEIVHDGAGFTRAQKIALIAQHPLARQTVKVCWQGPNPARNCGKCEKCVRTLLCFAAVGVDDPPSFDQTFDPAMIDTFECINFAQFSAVESALVMARSQANPPPWVPRLAARLDQLRSVIPMV